MGREKERRERDSFYTFMSQHMPPLAANSWLRNPHFLCACRYPKKMQQHAREAPHSTLHVCNACPRLQQRLEPQKISQLFHIFRYPAEMRQQAREASQKRTSVLKPACYDKAQTLLAPFAAGL